MINTNEGGERREGEGQERAVPIFKRLLHFDTCRRRYIDFLLTILLHKKCIQFLSLHFDLIGGNTRSLYQRLFCLVIKRKNGSDKV